MNERENILILMTDDVDKVDRLFWKLYVNYEE